MTTVNVYEAKVQLSRLLRRVEAGEEIVIARDGRPVARMVGVAAAAPRRYGVGEGKVWIAEDFDAPMLDVEAALDEPLAPPRAVRRRSGHRR
ncbi:MAG: type II toxin-antitoxin system prevent-host-death family antitoxin [Deltaproteobacteria bacterium]|nr:type II toxin-antitoxin system prevent-host-death family antitoxin [Deltaproteobacteria bacterium]